MVVLDKFEGQCTVKDSEWECALFTASFIEAEAEIIGSFPCAVAFVWVWVLSGSNIKAC